MNHRATLSVVILTLAAIVGPAGATEATRRPTQLYEGAAHIGNLARVTVVYPSAKGAAGAINKDSAELKASYLTRRYGVETAVTTDDAITPEQLSGNLMVLGWDNRLLQTGKVTLPWTRTDTKLSFLGLEGPRATDDLLFMCHSPFNERKYLIFWSRIDPELERFLSFPFIGSDWAIYRDYFVLHQGRFDDLSAWPPARNSFAEHDSSYHPPPRVRRSGHYALYYDAGLIDEEEERRIVASRESALTRAGELLGIAAPDNFEIKLYLYADAKKKHERTGVADPVHSMALRGELYMPVRYARSPNPHEEIHLLAANRFGSCPLSMMYEGLALLLESRAEPERQDSWAAMLVERQGIPPISDLVDDEGLRQWASGGLAFPAAALLIRWLEEVGGSEVLEKLYGMTRGEAVATITRVAGLDSEAETNERFRAWIEKRGTAGQDELAYRKAIAQGDARAEVGDFAGATEGYSLALELRPEDPTIRYRLAQFQIEIARYDAAREHLTGLLEMSPPPEPPWLRVFSRYQLARIDDFSGNREAAIAGYRSVLEMPDEHDAHRRAREALEMLGGPEN